MSRIKSIKAREIFNSNSDRAVEVELRTDSGVFYASAPSGVSKGRYEAVEREDAVKNIQGVIALAIEGKDARRQKELDELMIKMDGTENKSNLGVNAILPVSIAICRAGAAANGLPLYQYLQELKCNLFSTIVEKRLHLPRPCILLIEGGLHAGNKLSIQEFMVSPSGESFKEQLEKGDKIYDSLGVLLRESFGKQALNTGLEGGMTPLLEHSEQAVALIGEVMKKHDSESAIVIDAAASHFYDEAEGLYRFESSLLTSAELLEFYRGIIDNYNILGIEDPFSEDDLNTWKLLGPEPCVIGDDLTVTNAQRIKAAVGQGLISGVVIKPNQVGTVMETLEAVYMAQKNDLKIFIKHRSGETNDTFISDLAVGVGAEYIMTGAPCHGERVAKYNRLLKIESEM